MTFSPASKPFFWLFLLCFSLVFSFTTFAQDKDWRPVTPEELAQKTPVVEPDADAEAMFWEVRIDDTSEHDLSITQYVRVKIYTERGREQFSKFDVPFTKRVKIKDLSARVVRPDGSIVDIKPEDIFERDIVKSSGLKLRAKSFAVPNIEPGVIVEYRYKEAVKNAAAQGMHLEFQKDIPVQRLAYYYKPYGGHTPKFQPHNFSDTQFVKDKDGYWLASRTDVPSMKDEPNMPPEDEVRAWMRLTGVHSETVNFTEDIDGYTETRVIKDPSDPAKYWGSVGLQHASLTIFMNKNSGSVKKIAEGIVAGAANDDEKLRKLYEFCQTQISNTSYDPSLTDEMREKLPREKSVSDLIKKRSGSSGFIDMLFGAMAKSLGFETAIAYSGDRSEMFFSPDTTDETLIHAAAIAVKVNNRWKFFNPGIKFVPYGMLAWYEEDSYALIVEEKNYSWGKTPFTDYSTSVSNRKAKLTLNDDGSIEGDVTVEMNGQPAVAYRIENYDETSAKREQSLADDIKAQINAAEVSGVTVENVMDSSKPLIEKYHIRVPGYAQKTGKRLFLQPNYFKYGLGPTFSGADRKYDIFFRYPWSENDEIEINLPKNYDLDNADAPADVSDARKIGELTIRISVDRVQNSLKYSRKFHFGGGGSVLFGSQMYTPLKNMFDAFHQADSHTITLKQK